MTDLSVIIVSWNVVSLLRRCLLSIVQTFGLKVEILVVDNASSDGTVTLVENEFPEIQLIENVDNIGFVRANNQALRLSSGRHVLLLNPDTEVQPGALQSMVSYLDANPEIGAIGPRLLNPDGSVQPSRRRFPTLATAFVESTILQRWLPRSPLLRHYYVEDVADTLPHEVDWVTGAALMVRQTTIAQVGLLDERFFMYSEELDWCYRIKQCGWRVVYLPEAEIVHYEGKSSEQNLARRSIHFNDSKCRFFSKYYGSGWGALLRAFIFATFLYQFVEEGLKYLLGHKRALRRQRLAALAEYLGWQANQLVKT